MRGMRYLLPSGVWAMILFASAALWALAMYRLLWGYRPGPGEQSRRWRDRQRFCGLTVLVAVGIPAVLGPVAAYGGWYERRCVDSLDDIDECFEGKVGEARGWCMSHASFEAVGPGGYPDWADAGDNPGSGCVKDYLANGQPPAGQYMCAGVDPYYSDHCTPDEMAMRASWGIATGFDSHG